MKRYIIFGLMELFFLISFILLFDEIKTDIDELIVMILIIIFLAIWTILAYKNEK